MTSPAQPRISAAMIALLAVIAIVTITLAVTTDLNLFVRAAIAVPSGIVAALIVHLIVRSRQR